MHTHDDNWDTGLFKLIEQTSIACRFMFCSLHSPYDLIIINTDM
jgi:hypothetical protein